MVKQVAREVLGELLETGKTVAKQAKQVSPGKIAATVTEQVSGGAKSDDIPPGLEDLKGKKVTPSQLTKMRQDDAFKSKQGIDNTRLSLKQMIIQRYKRMQQQVFEKEKQREQEELEKKQKEMEELKTKEEAEKQEPRVVKLPKGPKPKGLLGIFVRQKQGTGEVKLGKQG